jgi:hypothetical protein
MEEAVVFMTVSPLEAEVESLSAVPAIPIRKSWV